MMILFGWSQKVRAAAPRRRIAFATGQGGILDAATRRHIDRHGIIDHGRPGPTTGILKCLPFGIRHQFDDHVIFAVEQVLVGQGAAAAAARTDDCWWSLLLLDTEHGHVLGHDILVGNASCHERTDRGRVHIGANADRCRSGGRRR